MDINRLRDSAGTLEVSDPDDSSPIQQMISTGDKLFVVKSKGIHEIRFADKIDPNRTNPAIPNTVQKVLPYGIEDVWVGAVILTAREFFLASSFDKNLGKNVFEKTLELAKELAGAKQIIERFSDKEALAAASANREISKNRSLVLPAIGNVESSCNEYLQRIDHALAELFKIVRMFYPDVNSGGWDELKKKIDAEPESTDNFSEFLEKSISFLRLIRNTRNCVEHPQKQQKLIVSDFSLDASNTLVPPTIKVVHPRTPVPVAGVSDFMNDVFSSTVNITELMIVFLAGRAVDEVAGLPVQIIELPLNQRKSPNIRYSYALPMNGQLVPLS